MRKLWNLFVTVLISLAAGVGVNLILHWCGAHAGFTGWVSAMLTFVLFISMNANEDW